MDEYYDILLYMSEGNLRIYYYLRLEHDIHALLCQPLPCKLPIEGHKALVI